MSCRRESLLWKWTIRKSVLLIPRTRESSVWNSSIKESLSWRSRLRTSLFGQPPHQTATHADIHPGRVGGCPQNNSTISKQKSDTEQTRKQRNTRTNTLELHHPTPPEALSIQFLYPLRYLHGISRKQIAIRIFSISDLLMAISDLLVTISDLLVAISDLLVAISAY